MNPGEQYSPFNLFVGVFVPNALLKIPSTVVSPGAKLLFGCLSWHSGPSAGESFPPQSQLAEEIGVSERSVQAYVKELEDAHFIKRVRVGPHETSYVFTWNEALDSCLRKTKGHPQGSPSHPQDPAGHKMESPAASPAGSCRSYKEEEKLREYKRTIRTPYTPQTDEQEPPAPLPVETEPSDLSAITVDNIADWMQNRCFEMTGKKLSKPTKRSLLRAALGLEQLGSGKFERKFVEYYANGAKSLDAFCSGFTPFRAARQVTTLERPASATRFAGSRRTPDKAEPSRARPSPVSAPSEAREWNVAIPDRAWVVWDQTLAGRWEDAVSAGILEHWPALIEKAKAVIDARNPKNVFLTFDYMLRNWSPVLNGSVNWLLDSGGRDSGGSNIAKANEAIAAALAMGGQG